nr:hypothetical protein [Tanacetum cinerariifolium]
LQALVEKKRVVVTEAAIRDALHLDDAEGVDCLPNEEIFTELARMGYEKPTTEVTFYNAFFSSQVGKGYSGVKTPLFKGMLVAREPKEHGDVEEQGNEEVQGNVDTTAKEPETAVLEDAATDQPIPSPTLLTLPPQQPQDEALDACAALARRVEHLEQDKVKGRHADIYNIDMDHGAKVLSMQEEESEVQEAVEVVTTAKLITKVVVDVSEIVSAAADIPFAVPETISVAAAVSTVIPPPVKVAAPVKAAVPSTRQKRGVVIWDPKEESSAKTPTETSSKTREKKLAKRRKLIKEAKEAESVKKLLQIVPDEDDDVFTEATPLARKVAVVDYQLEATNILWSSYYLIQHYSDYSVGRKKISTYEVYTGTNAKCSKTLTGRRNAAEKNDAAKSSKDC